MKISAVTAYVIKSPVAYRPAGQATDTETLPGTDYLRFAPYPQLYSMRSEAVIVRVDTDAGLVGWGECNAPVGPEITQTVIARILGPTVIGQNPLATNARFADMDGAMRIRGHFGSYQMDAIAGLDIALWDIRGKAADLPVSEMLGGRLRETLPCYASGLRGRTLEERCEQAAEWTRQGIGVKSFLGFGVREDTDEVTALREAVGSEGRLYVDTLFRYSPSEAVRLGRALERNGVEFFEAPLAPEDVPGHAALARDLDIAIAVGEPLRTRTEFRPWLQAQALEVCQHDLMRCGITEGVRIASLAEAFNVPVALHAGASTVIGQAATWQTAATLPNFLVQEHQPVMFQTFGDWLTNPLKLNGNELVVPDGPGLGIDINLERFHQDIDSQITVDTANPIPRR